MRLQYRFSIFLFLVINCLFITKYVSRVGTLYVIPVLIVYVLLILWLIHLYHKTYKRLANYKKLLKGVMILSLFVLVLLQFNINPYHLNVDRWSAIHNFLSNLFSGIYPYSAQTHLGGYGSPFPIWQLFHIPFYWLGNVGLSFVVAVFLFTDSLRRLYSFQHAFFCFVLLLMSPAFLYEVCVRSDLMTNFLICAAIIMYFRYYHISLNNNTLLVGLTIGLMASTRLSAVIPFAVYFLYEFMNIENPQKVKLVLVIASVFSFTFLPLLLWNGKMLLFFEYNPFILQSRQGHLLDFLLFIPIGIWLALTWKNSFRKYSLYTAVLLVLLVAVTFIHNMCLNHNFSQLFESAYDITYFCMALPFVIISLTKAIDKKECPSTLL